MIRKFNAYEYELIKNEGGWYYIIYDPDYDASESSIIRQSDDWHDSEWRANLAAIGHISLIENGEG
jgi:hypothetical protein